MEAIEDYLNTGPWDGREFREEMVKAGFCVSGSRALAFIMKGSGMHLHQKLQNSDWDIYTDGTVQSLNATIESLERLGVKFNSLLVEFDERIETSCGVLHIGMNELAMLHRHWKEAGRLHPGSHPRVNVLFETLSVWYSRPSSDPIRSSPRSYTIVFSKAEVVLLTIHTSKGYRSKDTKRKQGSKTYKDLGLTVVEGRAKQDVLVQVIAKPDQPVESVIMEFHSSAVQCAIGGHYAVHFYGKLARLKKSQFWHQNSQSPAKAVQAKRKYEDHGYSYVESPLSTSAGGRQSHRNFEVRKLTDNHAICTPAQPEPSQDSVPPLDLEWLEYAGCTRLTNPRKLPLSPTQPKEHFWLYVNSLPYSHQISTNSTAPLLKDLEALRLAHVSL